MTDQELAARGVATILLWDPRIAERTAGLSVETLRRLAGSIANAAIHPPTWLEEATATLPATVGAGFEEPAWQPPGRPRKGSGVPSPSHEPEAVTVDVAARQLDSDPLAGIPPYDPEVSGG